MIYPLIASLLIVGLSSAETTCTTTAITAGETYALTIVSQCVSDVLFPSSHGLAIGGPEGFLEECVLQLVSEDHLVEMGQGWMTGEISFVTTSPCGLAPTEFTSGAETAVQQNMRLWYTTGSPPVAVAQIAEIVTTWAQTTVGGSVINASAVNVDDVIQDVVVDITLDLLDLSGNPISGMNPLDPIKMEVITDNPTQHTLMSVFACEVFDINLFNGEGCSGCNVALSPCTLFYDGPMGTVDELSLMQSTSYSEESDITGYMTSAIMIPAIPSRVDGSPPTAISFFAVVDIDFASGGSRRLFSSDTATSTVDQHLVGSATLTVNQAAQEEEEAFSSYSPNERTAIAVIASGSYAAIIFTLGAASFLYPQHRIVLGVGALTITTLSVIAATQEFPEFSEWVALIWVSLLALPAVLGPLYLVSEALEKRGRGVFAPLEQIEMGGTSDTQMDMETVTCILHDLGASDLKVQPVSSGAENSLEEHTHDSRTSPETVAVLSATGGGRNFSEKEWAYAEEAFQLYKRTPSSEVAMRFVNGAPHFAFRSTQDSKAVLAAAIAHLLEPGQVAAQQLPPHRCLVQARFREELSADGKMSEIPPPIRRFVADTTLPSGSVLIFGEKVNYNGIPLGTAMKLSTKVYRLGRLTGMPHCDMTPFLGLGGLHQSDVSRAKTDLRRLTVLAPKLEGREGQWYSIKSVDTAATLTNICQGLSVFRDVKLDGLTLQICHGQEDSCKYDKDSRRFAFRLSGDHRQAAHELGHLWTITAIPGASGVEHEALVGLLMDFLEGKAKMDRLEAQFAITRRRAEVLRSSNPNYEPRIHYSYEVERCEVKGLRNPIRVNHEGKTYIFYQTRAKPSDDEDTLPSYLPARDHSTPGITAEEWDAAHERVRIWKARPSADALAATEPANASGGSADVAMIKILGEMCTEVSNALIEDLDNNKSPAANALGYLTKDESWDTFVRYAFRFSEHGIESLRDTSSLLEILGAGDEAFKQLMRSVRGVPLDKMTEAKFGGIPFRRALAMFAGTRQEVADAFNEHYVAVDGKVTPAHSASEEDDYRSQGLVNAWVEDVPGKKKAGGGVTANASAASAATRLLSGAAASAPLGAQDKKDSAAKKSPSGAGQAAMTLLSGPISRPNPPSFGEGAELEYSVKGFLEQGAVKSLITKLRRGERDGKFNISKQFRNIAIFQRAKDLLVTRSDESGVNLPVRDIMYNHSKGYLYMKHGGGRADQVVG